MGEYLLRGKVAEDITGRRYGKWLVLERRGSKGRRPLWLCRCECGTERVVLGDNLRQGYSTSCGCGEPEIPHYDRHGYKRPNRLYFIWVAIRQRCYNPCCKDFPRYGGRGITMCDAWRQDYEAFVHDMGPRPHGGTLERKDNGRGYYADNCVWATRWEQAQNRERKRAA